MKTSYKQIAWTAAALLLTAFSAHAVLHVDFTDSGETQTGFATQGVRNTIYTYTGSDVTVAVYPPVNSAVYTRPETSILSSGSASVADGTDINALQQDFLLKVGDGLGLDIVISGLESGQPAVLELWGNDIWSSVGVANQSVFVDSAYQFDIDVTNVKTSPSGTLNLTGNGNDITIRIQENNSYNQVRLCGFALLDGIAEEAQLDDSLRAISKSGQVLPYSSIIAATNGPRIIKYDMTGVRSIRPVPAPGVHPRILHSPEDRADLIDAYENTPYGQFVWTLLNAWTDKLKGINVASTDYPTYSDGTLLGPFNVGGWTEPAADYQQILAGNMSVLPENLMNSHMLALLCLELYRCWIDNDVTAGQTAATALADIAAHLSGIYEEGDSVSVMGAYNMGFGYDYGYGFMTTQQRSTIRQLIARASVQKAHYGAFLPGDAPPGNWMTLDSYIPFTLLAIEGEEGFNENYYDSFTEAYQKFIAYAWYESGACFEGLGKDYQFNTTMVILAKRGVNLVGHPHVKAFGQKFLPAACLPSGTGFIGSDDWGGTGSDTVLGNYRFNINDAIGLKWIFPNDKKVDYMWQKYVGDDFKGLNSMRPEGYYPSVLLAAMFPAERLMATPTRTEAELPLSLFCPERGYLLTRSDDSEDALMLTLHCRQNKGGHPSADRNSFIFAGLGRLWGHQMTQAGGSEFGIANESRYFSTVLIDDVGQCGASSGNFPVPGKMIDMQDGAELSYACGDAKYAYDWEWNWEDGVPGTDSTRLTQGWEKVLETPNDFQFSPIGYAYMDIPFYEDSHWLQPNMVMHYVKRPWNPVRKAFRTAAMVRGTHPYALIIDDIQKDDAPHQYKWLMQASSDLEIYSYAANEDLSIVDMMLCGREVQRDENDVRVPRTGDPMLLVRVLQCDNDMSTHRYTPIGRLEQYMSNPRYLPATGQRLVIPCYAVSPNYKVMLMPYRYGDTLPETVWNTDRTELTITWGDQQDVYTFSTPGTEDRTTFSMTRNGTPIQTSEPNVTAGPVELGLTTTADGQLILTGSSGVEGWQYRVLTTTNLATPADEWTVLSTNYANGDGTLQELNLSAEDGSAAFFKIVSP